MPEKIPGLPFEDELKRTTRTALHAVGPFPRDEYVTGVIVDYVKRKWEEEIGEHYYAWTKVIEHPVIADINFTEHGSPLDSVLARLDELADAENELKALMTPPAFVPHFKLHRDGSITPQQDDTPVWSTGPSPFALTVPESMVEEVEVTREPSSWTAGGTGVPTFWNLDKLREMRDGALQEWIEVEAIIREVEKREKEEASVEEKAQELYRAATPDARWETVADEYRRIARHVLGQEQS